MADKNNIPLGVKILSVLAYIAAAFSVIFALLFIIGAGFIINIPAFAIFGTGIFILLGIIMLGFAVLDFFVARGLWKGRNWARIFMIIVSCIGIVLALVSLFSVESLVYAILNIVINGLIAGYLLFNKKAKIFFA